MACWIKSRSKPLRVNINRKKQELKRVFLFVINKTLKLIWHKHDLVIYSLVGCGHTDKYSHEYLSGYGNLLGKIDSIKRNHWDFLGFFFNWEFPFSDI